MSDSKGLIQHINEDFPRLSKGQRALVKFITENTDEAAFLTAAKLGKKVGVSESTVVRFSCCSLVRQVRIFPPSVSWLMNSW